MRILKQIYKACRKRKVIQDSTNINDFEKKMIEELAEILIEKDIKSKIPEIVDLMTVCTNTLIHYKVNIRKELSKNRKKNINKAKQRNWKQR